MTPRRARCAECGATQILLPGALSARRADATDVIGHALAAAKAAGSGFRAIAATLGRPEATVRRWWRRAPEHHARWLYQRAWCALHAEGPATKLAPTTVNRILLDGMERPPG